MGLERSRITFLTGAAALVATLAARAGARAGTAPAPGITVYKSPS